MLERISSNIFSKVAISFFKSAMRLSDAFFSFFVGSNSWGACKFANSERRLFNLTNRASRRLISVFSFDLISVINVSKSCFSLLLWAFLYLATASLYWLMLILDSRSTVWILSVKANRWSKEFPHLMLMSIFGKVSK